MIRLILALRIAPMWVLLVVGPAVYWALSSFNSPETEHFVTRLVIVCAVFSWGGTFVLWLPVMRALSARRFGSVWTATAVGFVAALPTFLVALVAFGWVMDGSLARTIEWLARDFWLDAAVYTRLALIMAVLGALVGLTAWLISRPNFRQVEAQAQD